MADIIYTETSGAQITTLFGCTVKNITAQMGFNSKPIIFTIKLVEENSQDFTLDENAILSIQDISFGKLHLLGLVKSWEKTTIDIGGSGMYTVRLTDCREIFDRALMTYYVSEVLPELKPEYFSTSGLEDYLGVGGASSSSDFQHPGGISPSVPGPDPYAFLPFDRNSVNDYIADYWGDDLNQRFPAIGSDEDSRGSVLYNMMPIQVETTVNPEESNQETTYFQDVINAVSGHRFFSGPYILEVDTSELEALDMGSYELAGRIRTFPVVLNEVCREAGVDWWVDSNLKDGTTNIIIVTIKTVSRSSLLGDDTPEFSLDDLAILHGDTVIRRIEGHESQDARIESLIWGGVRKTLVSIPNSDIRQFWGFDGGVPSSPQYNIPGDPPWHQTPTTIEEMQSAINGDLDGTMGTTKLNALIDYANTYWGKQFYFVVTNATLPRYEYETDDPVTYRRSQSRWRSLYSTSYRPPLPRVTPYGWWEGNDFGFTGNALIKLRTDDGQWKAFVQLPHSQSWSPTLLGSNNIITMGDNTYSKCTVTQSQEDYRGASTAPATSGRFVVITLPVAMTTYGLDAGGQVSTDIVTRENTLSNAWIPLMDHRMHYGPWRNSHLDNIPTPWVGHAIVKMEADLVPWNYASRDTTHTEAMEKLSTAAHKRIDKKIRDSIITNGQLEVAGIPLINIGQIIDGTSNITEMFIKFDTKGITTRYVVNLYSKNMGSFVAEATDRYEKDEIEDQQEDGQPDQPWGEDEEEEDTTEDETQSDVDLSEILKAIEALEERADEQEEWIDGPRGPTDQFLEYTMRHPEGGRGIIAAVGPGPHYTIRRMNYADLGAGPSKISIFAAPEWTDVRNLAEPDNSPGWLPIGTFVSVSIFSDSDDGPFIPYIEQTPQVFSPPKEG